MAIKGTTSETIITNIKTNIVSKDLKVGDTISFKLSIVLTSIKGEGVTPGLLEKACIYNPFDKFLVVLFIACAGNKVFAPTKFL